jgi:YfiH family protein
MDKHNKDGITCLTFGTLARVPGLVHAASTRRGGVSKAPFDSLNLGFRVGDDAEAVIENRRRFARAAGFALEGVVATAQVHGINVREVGRADCGTGAFELPPDAWACDALVTAQPNLFLMGFGADCPLVLLADPKARVAALAHAGWRSAFAGILARTLAAMRHLGAEPGRIIAGIAPAAHGCCYEVGGELKDALAGSLPDVERFFTPRGEKFLLDLPRVCRELLKAQGVQDGNIESAQSCTMCDGEFFSHRSSGGKTGRQASVVGWTE